MNRMHLCSSSTCCYPRVSSPILCAFVVCSRHALLLGWRSKRCPSRPPADSCRSLCHAPQHTALDQPYVLAFLPSPNRRAPFLSKQQKPNKHTGLACFSARVALRAAVCCV